MTSPLSGGVPLIIRKGGKVAYLFDGWTVENSIEPQVVKFGILQDDIIKLADRGQNSALAQLDSIVAPGLISARHIFRGLNRPMLTDHSMDADVPELVYAWRQMWDFDWPAPHGTPRRWPRPENCVFVVIAGRNIQYLEKWPEVYGWINRWNWVDEDPGVPEAPLNWSSRYAEKMFTRKGA